MHTVKVRDLHRGDAVVVNGRSVVLREDPWLHCGEEWAFRYRAPGIIVGLLTAPSGDTPIEPATGES